MITFIYTVKDHSEKRGYNQTITVWRLRKNVPYFVNYNDKINTAYTYGEKAEAMRIIRDNTPFKMNGSYKMARKDIQLFKV